MDSMASQGEPSALLLDESIDEQQQEGIGYTRQHDLLTGISRNKQELLQSGHDSK
jgi:hypothetical protein